MRKVGPVWRYETLRHIDTLEEPEGENGKIHDGLVVFTI